MSIIINKEMFIRGALLREVGFSKCSWLMVSANRLQVFILLLRVALRKTSLTYKPRGSEGLKVRPSLCLRFGLVGLVFKE